MLLDAYQSNSRKFLNACATRGRQTFSSDFFSSEYKSLEFYSDFIPHQLKIKERDETGTQAYVKFQLRNASHLATVKKDGIDTPIRKKFGRMLLQRMAHAKTQEWAYGMNEPMPIDGEGHLFSIGYFNSDSLKHDAVHLSEEFFLKYAYHVESHKNVWDIQYKASEYADWYKVDNDLRLPYPVMWLEAPNDGYTLNPPKKRLDDRIRKEYEASQTKSRNHIPPDEISSHVTPDWKPIYDEKIGGILIVEADLLPVNNHIPEEGKEELRLKNMIWHLPHSQYKITDHNNSLAKIVGRRDFGKGEFGELMIDELYSKELRDLDLDNALLTAGLGRVKDSPWKHHFNASNWRYQKKLQTVALPLGVMENHFSPKYKTALANELWRIDKCNFDEILGLYGVPIMHDLKPEEQARIPADLYHSQRGFVNCLWDGEKQEIIVRDMTQDPYTMYPTYHLSIPNFPKEGITTRGVLAPEAAIVDTVTDKALDVSVHQRLPPWSTEGVSNRHHTPAIMLTGFNDKSLRTTKPLQQWLCEKRRKQIQVVDSANTHDRNDATTNMKLWRKNLNERQGIVFDRQSNTGMALTYHSKHMLLDDLENRPDGKMHWGLVTKQGWFRKDKPSGIIRETFVLENLLSGLYYGKSARAINEAIDKNLDRIERYNLPIEEYYPDYDEKKHESVSLFLADKKLELKTREHKKIDEIGDSRVGTTAIEYASPEYQAMILEPKWSHALYDMYTAMEEHSIRSRRDEAKFTAKWLLQEMGWEQRPMFWSLQGTIQDASNTKEQLENAYRHSRKGLNYGSFSWKGTTPVLMRHLRDSYAASLDWHTNKAEKRRKFMLATVYNTEGKALLRIPIPSDIERTGDLLKFYDALWDSPVRESQEIGELVVKTWQRDDLTVKPILANVFSRDATNHYENKSYSHFAKETIQLLLGVLQFMNRPDVKIIPTPFAERRGAKQRNGTHKKERALKEERGLKRRNHKIKLTGIAKKYAEMSPITNTRGKLNKRFQVKRHTRLQPYPTRGTVEEIWIEPYWKGEGKVSARPILELDDKRGDEDV